MRRIPEQSRIPTAPQSTNTQTPLATRQRGTVQSLSTSYPKVPHPRRYRNQKNTEFGCTFEQETIRNAGGPRSPSAVETLLVVPTQEGSVRVPGSFYIQETYRSLPFPALHANRNTKSCSSASMDCFRNTCCTHSPY